MYLLYLPFHFVVFHHILEKIISDTNLMENEKEDNDLDENEDPVSIPTITAGLQHVLKIRKVFSSLEYAEEMLS